MVAAVSCPPAFRIIVALRHPQAASSDGKSLVAYLLQSSFLNSQRILLSLVPEFSRSVTMVSVCCWSFTKACQVTSSDRSLQIILSCFGGNKSSKTRIEHLYKMRATGLVTNMVSYLKKVLIISSSKLLHCRGIVAKFLNSITPKRCDSSESKYE